MIVIADKDVDGLMSAVLFLRRYRGRVKRVSFVHAGYFIKSFKLIVRNCFNEKIYVLDIPLTQASMKYIMATAHTRNMKFILIDHHLQNERFKDFFHEAYIIRASSTARVLSILWKKEYHDAMMNYYVEIADYIDNSIRPTSEFIRRDAEMISRILSVYHHSNDFVKIARIIAEEGVPLSFIDEIVEMDKCASSIVERVMRYVRQNMMDINGVKLLVLEKPQISIGYILRRLRVDDGVEEAVVVWSGGKKTYITIRSIRARDLVKELTRVLQVVHGGGRASSLTLVVRNVDINFVVEKVSHVVSHVLGRQKPLCRQLL